jgi:hypothetical protein
MVSYIPIWFFHIINGQKSVFNFKLNNRCFNLHLVRSDNSKLHKKEKCQKQIKNHIKRYF